MGEYANDQIRRDIKRMTGFDPGDLHDEPRRTHAKPVYKRVKCPQCDATPKERGLRDHLRDVHGVKEGANG
jgi:hypothetical protein